MFWILLLAGTALWLIANYWFKSLFFNNRFFWVIGIAAIFFLTSFFYSALFGPSKIALGLFVLFFATDILFLFAFKGKPEAKRIMAERMSNGDKNPVTLQIENSYPFAVSMRIIDEMPDQFQSRTNFFEK